MSYTVEVLCGSLFSAREMQKMLSNLGVDAIVLESFPDLWPDTRDEFEYLTNQDRAIYNAAA